ncbi:MAG: lipoyl(octanoyl) transferase LipB [Actinobacteria bacterium]|nr:lipoyl(octanoyl) transferase LipB [Actinomycetota bacterium]
MPPELLVTRLGRVDYDEALALQRRLHAARAAGAIPDVLLLLEHPPVYTRGRRAEAAELPMGEDWYREQGIAIRDVDRGGKTTYHGPGQLVGYPIVDTAIVGRDVVKFVRTIEDALIAALAAEGVAARRDENGRGVWAGEGKVASLGLHIAGGVTTHGFAVNVDCDLAPFTWIKPCGLDDPATSILEQTGQSHRMRCLQRRAAFELASRLGLRQRLISRDRLVDLLTAVEPVATHDLVFAQ